MKKLFFILVCIAASQIIFSQEPADALRYSFYPSSGTARQQAIGGAMGSVGGDISATFVNPAGLGFFKTSDFVISPGYRSLNNKATYLGRTEEDKISKPTLGLTGFVLGNGQKTGRTQTAISLLVNRTASFNNATLYRGLNNQNSYSQQFLEEINNDNNHNPNAVAKDYPFGTSLAFNTYWIDTVDGGTPDNAQFKTRSPIASGLIQENIVNSKGGITEFALGLAGNRNDKFYYGLTLGIPVLNYKRETSFSEADATNDAANNFDFASVNKNLETKGTGFNLKLGIIYKPTKQLRLGLAFHTPTFYSLTDNYSTTIITDTEGYKGRLNQSSLDFNEEGAQFKYWHFTAYKALISAAYIFQEIEDVKKQKGFVTADIEYINYKAASFTSSSEDELNNDTKAYFKSLNKAIDNSYKGAFNIKVGGELKFTTFMARLGAAYYGNPYKDLGHNENGNRFQLTGGLGFRDKGIFVDLAYAHTIGKDVDFAYRLQNQTFSGASIKNLGRNILLTVGTKF